MAEAYVKKHIGELHVNGMSGRILRMPAPKRKKRQILLLYGHHSSLERMFGLAEVLNKYGAVTMPDLPGFGGMDSFFKIGEKPTLDNYADYLASIVKLNYKRKRVTIIAMSFSVPLVIRMLQKYPELSKKVDIFVSIAGFARKDDFIFTKTEYWGLRLLASLLSRRVPAFFMTNIVLTKPIIKASYMLVNKSHSKMKDAINKAELDRRIEFETKLWQLNDMRTRASTINMMLKIDVCNSTVDKVQVYHVTATTDRYFDHKVVEQHMRIIFENIEIMPSEMANHAPTIIATAKEAEPYIPKDLRKLLNKMV